MDKYRQVYDSPLGHLSVEATEDHITRVEFNEPDGSLRPNPLTRACCSQLTEYFEGNRTIFDLPLNPAGTAFQKQIWEEMVKTLPFGRTCAYSDLANAVGNPGSVRAVGGANNRNPVVIIIPCHRVIGRDGRLTGFGAGIDRKIRLLEHEGHTITNERLQPHDEPSLFKGL